MQLIQVHSKLPAYTCQLTLTSFGLLGLWIESNFIINLGELCSYVTELWGFSHPVEFNTSLSSQVLLVCTLGAFVSVDECVYIHYMTSVLIPIIVLCWLSRDVESLVATNKISAAKAKRMYCQLNKITRTFNDTFGYVLLFLVITDICSYSVNLGHVFHHETPVGEKIYHFGYSSISACITGFAAQFAYYVVFSIFTTNS